MPLHMMVFNGSIYLLAYAWYLGFVALVEESLQSWELILTYNHLLQTPSSMLEY